jgi:hypothetical protein
VNHEITKKLMTGVSVAVLMGAAGVAGAGLQGVVGLSGEIVAAEDDGTIPVGVSASDAIIAIGENRNVVLAAELRVNIVNPGLYDQPSDIRRARVAAGTLVDSYLLSFDNEDQSGLVRTGSITFARDVVGIMIFDESLVATEALFSPFQVDEPAERGTELAQDGGPEFIELSADRRTVTLRLGNDTTLDQIRILTNAIPGPGTLAAAWLVCLAGGVRRRR